MKIVFFGTSPFGLPSLEALSKSKHTLSAIITTPDKPKGRHLKVSPSPVKEWALAKGLPVTEVSRLDMLKLEEILKKTAADVFVVISFGIILPEKILTIPKLAALNVHSSLLPRYRGPAPIHWALLNGDAETGVTVIRMNASLDTGDILIQEETTILAEDDEKILHDRLSRLGAHALLETLAQIEQNKVRYSPQDEQLATYARKITKEDGHIRWNETASTIHNRVRALSGWPGAYAFLKGKRILILKSAVAPSSAGLPASPGQILQASPEKGILVAAKEGALRIEELQMEGRKPLSAAFFLQGCPLKPGELFE